MKPCRIIFFFVILVTIFGLFQTCTHKTNKPQPRIVNGVLDLYDWDFNQDGPVVLRGKWEFYWNQLLKPSDFQTAIQPVMSGYIDAPGFWDSYRIDNRELGGEGYATYRIRIRNLKSNLYKSIRLSLFPDVMFSSYHLTVNGKPLLKNGKVGKNRISSEPHWLPLDSSFIVSSDELEVLLQVSNFHLNQGGAWGKIQLGTEKQIRNLRERALAMELFLIGALLIMGFYHLGIFALRGADLSPLWFGILCLTMALRTLLVGERFLVQIFPNMEWELFISMAYLTFYLAIPIYVYYLHSIFPKESVPWFLQVIVICGLIASVIVIFTPSWIFSYTTTTYQILTIIVGVYSILVPFRAKQNHREGARLFLFGFAIAFSVLVNDILTAAGYIPGTDLFHIGMLVFIFIQAFILSRRFAKAFFRVSELSVELENSNLGLRKNNIELTELKEHLEEKVEERTSQLRAEREKSDQLLLNILPAEVAEELKEKGRAEPRNYDSATIMFTDFVGFTRIAEKMPPNELLKELNYIFLQFDTICARYGVEKMKTIGDAYMAACGIPSINNTHPIDVCRAALEIQSFMKSIRKKHRQSGSNDFWGIRIGIHTGPVVAGVVGKTRFAYDIWGDAVNVASRMESNGVEDRINISEDIYKLVKDFFVCKYRGDFPIKNRGRMKMFFLNCIRPELSQDKEKLVANEEFMRMYESVKLGISKSRSKKKKFQSGNMTKI